jgi:hypothetical protein
MKKNLFFVADGTVLVHDETFQFSLGSGFMLTIIVVMEYCIKVGTVDLVLKSLQLAHF